MCNTTPPKTTNSYASGDKYGPIAQSFGAKGKWPEVTILEPSGKKFVLDASKEGVTPAFLRQSVEEYFSSKCCISYHTLMHGERLIDDIYI